MSNLTLEVTHPPHVMLSSDYSQQEPKITASVTHDRALIDAFVKNRDAYATISSIALGFPYEECLEFNPITGEQQPEGKARRSIGKVLNLGITYGMSVQSISDSLFGDRDDMTDDQKLKESQKIHDSLMKGFPGVAKGIANAQQKAKQIGYTETILGRRRHHPNMQLPRFEFEPMDGYMNPDIDPLDPESLKNKEQIPKRIVDALTKEFNSYKWYGKIVKRTKELAEEKIKVINNSYKIEEASRQCFNCVDKETEILTLTGWKKWNEVQVGDKILSYSVEHNRIEEDVVNDVHIYNEPTEVIDFNSPTFNASSTPEHRWAVWYNNEARFVSTEQIERNKWPDYSIIRVGDNDFEEHSISDTDLRMLGWVLTDASVQGDSITLYQSTNRGKNAQVYTQMISTLDELGLEYIDRTYEKYPGSHQICIKVSVYSRHLAAIVQHDLRILTFDFVSKLSQRQCNLLMKAILQRGGSGVDGSGSFIDGTNVDMTCSSLEKCNVFQYLAFRAGFATRMHEITLEEHNSTPSANIVYDSVSNDGPIHTTKSYFSIGIYRTKHAQIYPSDKSRRIAEDGVWCVSTNNLTWVARRKGLTYVTGNSIIQGSAADLTKMAMLRLEHDPEWLELGGRFLLPIHDELLCEVPLENAERGAEVLSRCMCEAGSFLPFPLKCDVEVNYRWYGISINDIAEREKPTSLDWESLSTSNVEWIQCMLIENEYLLPVFKEEDGSKPKGVRARGINGVITDELQDAVKSYMNRYQLTDDQEFLDHIEAKVTRGVY